MVDKIFVGLVIVCYILLCTANEGNKNRRLVLHNDTDVVEELNKLRAELDEQKNEIRNVTASMATMNSKLAEKDAEIKTLASKFQHSVSDAGKPLYFVRNKSGPPYS